MDYKILGKDLKVSAVGLGCMGMSHAYGSPADKNEMCELITKAVDLGYNFFDTAEIYGTANNPQFTADGVCQNKELLELLNTLAKDKNATATDADRKLHKQVATLNKIIPSFNNGKMIKITDKCIGCKICEKVCPTGNIIVLTDYAQRRSKKCEYCLACVHACPQKAIIIKHEKNKNERYRNENVSLDEIIKSNFQNRRKCYE